MWKFFVFLQLSVACALVELTDENFAKIVKKQYNPWMILFHNPKTRDSSEMLQIFRAVIPTFKHKINFGIVDCSRNIELPREYEVGDRPVSVLLIHEATYYLHHGNYLSSKFLDEWISNKLIDYEEDSDVAELVTQPQYEKCLERRWCFLVFLPNIVDCARKCRKVYLGIVSRLNDKYVDHQYGWLWSQLGDQKDLEESLHVRTSKPPILVAIDGKRRKYINYQGCAFSLRAVDDFLQTTLRSLPREAPDLDAPARIRDVEMWNDGDDMENKNNPLDYFDIKWNVKDDL